MPPSDQRKESFLQHLISSGRLRAPEASALGRDAIDAYPEKLAAQAVEKGLLSERSSAMALADFYRLPFIDLDVTIVAPSAIQALSPETARELEVLPFMLNADELSVAMPSLDLDTVARVCSESGCQPLVHLATRSQILAAIDLYYATALLPEQDRMADLGEHLARGANSPMAKEIADSLVMNALRLRASDIHVEPQDSGIRVRLRVDGVLREEMRFPSKLSSPLVARFKIMADLDIAETRHPQDGRIAIQTETRSLDLRVSFAPTAYGEKVVIRLLDRSGAQTDLRAMELSVAVASRLQNIIAAPNGIVLITGPTGSGKSTTCYAILEQLNTPGTNIVTIEDPVEYRIEGLTQIQVQHGIGLDFSSILRSVLRQDPDVILVGEIRDAETARIAVQAAQTGHLVISTLHTNNAVQAVLRLVEMGVDPFLVAPSLNGILGQRLARRICGRCKRAYAATPDDLRLFAPYDAQPRELFRGSGCVDCAETGFRGRLGIHELVVVNADVRQLICEGAPVASIEAAARREGYRPLRYDGLKKILLGLTTTAEVKRTTIAREDFNAEH